MKQRARDRVGARHEEHRGAGRARWRAGEQVADKGLERRVVGPDVLEQQFAAALPGRHHGEDREAQHQREPAPLQEFERARGDEDGVEDKEEPSGAQRDPQRVVPPVTHDEEREQRSDEHRQRDRDTVGRGQRRGRPEACGGQHHRAEQYPVDRRDIDLADFLGRGVHNVHSWQKPELDRLLCHRVGARDYCLRCDHGGDCGQAHGREQQGLREHAVERVLQRPGIRHQQRALAHVVDRERGQHEPGPRKLDRATPEMAKVGVQRFRAGQGEHDRADRGEHSPAACGEEVEGMDGVQRGEDRGGPGDLQGAGDRECDEPQHDDGAEVPADGRRAMTLDEEEPREDAQGQRQHVRLERGRGDFEAFDG